MFDFAFSELVVIGVVALIVIGPERLPKVARTMGLLFGRAQRYVTEIKADINNQLKLEELRKIEADLRASAQNAEHVIIEETQRTEQEFRAAADTVTASAEAPLVAVDEPNQPQPDGEIHVAAAQQLEQGLDASRPQADNHAKAP